MPDGVVDVPGLVDPLARYRREESRDLCDAHVEHVIQGASHVCAVSAYDHEEFEVSLKKALSHDEAI